MALTLLATTDTQIIRVVEALYNQRPGYTYLNNFKTFVTENSMNGFANALAANFASSTDAELAAIVTTNLGLGDAAAAGNAYLEAQFAADASNRGKAILDAMNTLSTLEGDAVYGAAAVAYNADVAGSLTYSSAAANTAVTESTVNAATGQSYSLTSGTDTLTGTSANDTYSAVLQAAGATGTTVAPGDTINGGAGTDTLSIAVAGDNDTAASDTVATAYTLSAISTTDVEKVTLSNFDTDGNDGNIVDAALMNGLTTVGLSSSSATGDTTFSNVKNIVDGEMRNGAADLTITYDTTVVTGTADVQDLTVSNLTAGTVTVNSVETVNITSELAKSTLTQLSADAMTALNVSGDQNLTITANAVDFANATSATAVDGVLDASALSGDLSVLMAADVVTVTGGSGNDTINMAATLTAADTIDGGAGTDTVVVSADTTTLTSMGITNVEKIQAEATANANLSVVTTGFAGLETLILEENATTTKAMSVTDLAAGVSVELINNVNTTKAIGAVTLGLEDASGSADELTVTLKGTATHAAADNTVASLAITDVETVNIVSSHAGTTALAATDDNTVSTYSADTALTTMNLSGSDQLDITLDNGATKLATIDGSGMTDELDLTVAATVNQTITGGSANDTITMAATLNQNDSVDGGAGTDTLSATVTSATATTGALTVANVEKVNLTNGGSATIDATGIVSASEIAFASTTATTVTNLAAGATVGVGFNAAATDSDGTFTLSLADETGSEDSVNINFNGTDGTADHTVTLKATAIETVNLNLGLTTGDTAMADALLTVSALNASTINATSVSTTNHDVGQELTLGTLDTDTTTLDASGFRGVVSVTAGAATATNMTVRGDVLHSLTGSSGNDTFTVSTATTNADMTIDGNGGTDTLNMTLGNGAQDLDSITDVDTLNLTISNSADITTALAGTLDGINEATKVNFLGGNASSSVTLGAGGTVELTESNSSVLDFSGFNGTLTNAVFALDDFDSAETVGVNMQVIGTANADKITVDYDADTDASVTINTQGIETIALDMADSNVELVLDMTAVTGLTDINITDASSERIDLYQLMAGVDVNVTSDHGTATTVEIRGADVSGSTDTQEISVGALGADDGVAVVISNVETLSISGTTANQVDLDLSNAAMTATGAVMSVDFTGSNDIELVATNADITTIDASGMSSGGAIVQTARSATTASDYTGSIGNDTFIMMHANDAMNGATGTSDTLDINYTAILGGISVDLSNATNQISSMNGSSNSAVQVGFENVDLAGFSGFGATVTAAVGGSTISGTASTDSITGGAGNDIIDGNAGDDTIATGAGDDVIHFDATSDGNDTITDFTSGTDIMDFDGILDGVTKVFEAEADDSVGTSITTDANVIAVGGAVSIADAATFIAADTTVTGTVGLIIVDDGSHSYVYHSSNLGTNGTETLLATLTGVTAAEAMVTGDFIFA